MIALLLVAAVEVTTYDSEAQIMARLLEEKPRVIAFGEYHELTGGAKARSAISHFTDELLALTTVRASDLIVETWVTTGNCGKTETQAVAKVEKHIQRPKTVKTELEILLERTQQLGLRPHILTITCDEYRSIQPDGGDVDYIKLLSVVTGALKREIDAALKKSRPEKTVLVYGGAVHNDLEPRPELKDYTFGPAVRDQVGGRYLEVDLYVPEFIERDKDIVKEGWYALYKKKAKPGKPTLVKRSPGSYIVVFPRSG
jgi:hypothetical protein